MDRVRFGIRALDINQLRMPVSKELVLIARIYGEQVKVEPIKQSKKNTLSSKIQSATMKAAKSCESIDKLKTQPAHYL